MDFARAVREGKLNIAAGGTLRINGKLHRHDGTKLTKPPVEKRKAASRQRARAARRARRR